MTDCLLKQLPDPHISKESLHKGELRLTFDGYSSGTKIAEETGSNHYCSAATAYDSQASRPWSGPQQSYSRGARLLEGKLKNKEITSSSTNWTSTQRPNLKVSNYKDDRWINPQRWEETSAKRMKTPKTRMPLLLKGSQLLTSKGTRLDGE